MMSRHQDGILYEDYIKKFEIIAFKSSHALNAQWKWSNEAREISKLFVKIELVIKLKYLKLFLT